MIVILLWVLNKAGLKTIISKKQVTAFAEDMMNDVNLKSVISSKFAPFIDEILSRYRDGIDSINLIGSALTEDYEPKASDINSVFVLPKMDFEFLRLLAPLGNKYGKKRIAAPLIMTPDYIRESVDVFPIEFLNIKLLHNTIMGEDIFERLEIKRSDLRYQCERELKVRLIGLRQGYIASAGNRKVLTQGFVDSFSGYMPLFRGIIVLLGQKAPPTNNEVLTALKNCADVDTGVFQTVLKLKREKAKPSNEQLDTIFEDYYDTLEKLANITNTIRE
jgi:predicted nucleotidyltransferase